MQLRHVTPLEVNTLDPWCFLHMLRRLQCVLSRSGVSMLLNYLCDRHHLTWRRAGWPAALCCKIQHCVHVCGSVMCFIWLSQKGLHEWTFPASAIRGVRYCALMGKLSFPHFFLFSISKLAAVYNPTRAALFWPQSSDFLWIGLFFFNFFFYFLTCCLAWLTPVIFFPAFKL